MAISFAPRQNGVIASNAAADRSSWLLQNENHSLLLVGALIVCGLVYGIYYSASIAALTLLGGVVCGQAAGFFAAIERKNGKVFAWAPVVIAALVFWLAVASCWNRDSVHLFKYQARERWAGPWGNPNTFGLLMGVGLIVTMALGCAANWILTRRTTTWRFAFRRWGVAGACFLAMVLLGRGLAHSFSRGAWLATGWRRCRQRPPCRASALRPCHEAHCPTPPGTFLSFPLPLSRWVP